MVAKLLKLYCTRASIDDTKREQPSCASNDRNYAFDGLMPKSSTSIVEGVSLRIFSDFLF